MGGMGHEPLAEEAQRAKGNRQHEHAGGTGHDRAGRRQADKGESCIVAERNAVDQPTGEGERHPADQRAGHVKRAEPGMAELELSPNRGAEQADIEGLPEAGKQASNRPKPRKGAFATTKRK